MPEPEKAIPHHDIELNDKTIRLIGIPFFGIVIPNATGLFGALTMRDAAYWLGYGYFIALALFIWHGNRYLLFRTRKRFTWFDKPIEKLILLFLNNIFYTSPLTIAWLCMWYAWVGFDVKWNTVLVVTLINVICVLFITHVYETVFMVKEQQGEQVRNAQLSKAKAEAELEALKNQIDPHFMFNSLNSLAYLIDTHPATAKLFTENLADVYRYILSQKDRSLVQLEDEFAFLEKYAELLRLRFGKALELQKHFNGTTEKDFLLPPISAFVAFENAVKHNEISERTPLCIAFRVEHDVLFIQNSLQPKRTLQHSSHIGLKNLNERFRIIVGKEITVTKSGDSFVVGLPLLRS
ncbi:sensor histidine kinase [Chryseolinea lacunae]|uniref:Histidine kinase n=1 Tax=Chryseolinea lacunae TaxID=2801331 RepID=A0ABS1KKV2_9BACT|nr:sensor histidine kinase [Chryseolinea lacunae]MBL0740086.1 histidine kinase [Chryseolinea lacunae]